MHNRPSYYEAAEEEAASYFNTIYQSAKRLALNSDDVKAQSDITLVLEHTTIDVLYNGYSPVGLLAKEGEDLAVNILFKNYAAKLDDILEGYALGGNKDKVYEYLYKKIVLNQKWLGYIIAVSGAARGSHSLLVNDLIDNVTKFSYILTDGTPVPIGDLLSTAAMGYAYVNDTENVAKILTKGAKVTSVLEGYAYVGNIEKIIELLEKYPDIDLSAITRGSINSRYLQKCLNGQDQTLLRLFALCDAQQRKKLLQAFKDADTVNQIAKLPKSNIALFVELLEQLEAIIAQFKLSFKDAYRAVLFSKQYQLTLDQASAWVTTPVQVWILEVVKNLNLDNQNAMLPETYFNIASYLAMLSDHATFDLFDKMHFGVNKNLLVNHLAKVIKDESKERSSQFATHFTLFTDISKQTSKQDLLTYLNDLPEDEFYQDHIATYYTRLNQ